MESIIDLIEIITEFLDLGYDCAFLGYRLGEALPSWTWFICCCLPVFSFANHALNQSKWIFAEWGVIAAETTISRLNVKRKNVLIKLVHRCIPPGDPSVRLNF